MFVNSGREKECKYKPHKRNAFGACNSFRYLRDCLFENCGALLAALRPHFREPKLDFA